MAEHEPCIGANDIFDALGPNRNLPITEVTSALVQPWSGTDWRENIQAIKAAADSRQSSSLNGNEGQGTD